MATAALETQPPEMMSEAEFYRFSTFILARCGIKLSLSKKTMLEARLQKRLRSLGIQSFREYGNYALGPKGIESELARMLDVVTTNKTDFFREPGCFDYLTQAAVPEIINASGSGVHKALRVWSAGCSSGEEPYTLAMVLQEFAETCPGFHFSILATDISTRVLKTAARAVYEEERVASVPPVLRYKYLMVSKNRNDKLVRVVPELRATVEFRRLNFMDGDYGINGLMDVIFCRNVIIYFDRETQERLMRRLCRYLAPGGYLFMGHSEILAGMDLPLARVAQTGYKKV